MTAPAARPANRERMAECPQATPRTSASTPGRPANRGRVAQCPPPGRQESATPARSPGDRANRRHRSHPCPARFHSPCTAFVICKEECACLCASLAQPSVHAERLPAQTASARYRPPPRQAIRGPAGSMHLPLELPVHVFPPWAGVFTKFATPFTHVFAQIVHSLACIVNPLAQPGIPAPCLSPATMAAFSLAEANRRRRLHPCAASSSGDFGYRRYLTALRARRLRTVSPDQSVPAASSWQSHRSVPHPS